MHKHWNILVAREVSRTEDYWNKKNVSGKFILLFNRATHVLCFLVDNACVSRSVVAASLLKFSHLILGSNIRRNNFLWQEILSFLARDPSFIKYNQRTKGQEQLSAFDQIYSDSFISNSPMWRYYSCYLLLLLFCFASIAFMQQRELWCHNCNKFFGLASICF